MLENKDFPWPENKIEPQTYEDTRKWYRTYVNDPKAELPDEVVLELIGFGTVEIPTEVVEKLRKLGKIK